MYCYIHTIVALSLPISYVANHDFGDFRKIDKRISIKAFHETILQLVELVEVGVRKNLERTQGAVMNDA